MKRMRCSNWLLSAYLQAVQLFITRVRLKFKYFSELGTVVLCEPSCEPCSKTFAGDAGDQ